MCAIYAATDQMVSALTTRLLEDCDEKLYLHDKSTKPLQAFEALEPQTQRLLAPLTEAQARQLVQITWPAMKRKVDYRVKKATEK